MKKYPYPEARKMIHSICTAAFGGEYDAREKFFAMLENHPGLAVQGYNAFGKIFYWNDASTALYGYGEAAAVNRDLFELILPPELRTFARDMILAGAKTGKMPEAATCDLMHRNGEFVTVYSGHLLFRWPDSTVPEFYCIDLPIGPDSEPEKTEPGLIG